MHKLIFFSICFICFILSEAATAKKYYKHVDEDGVVHYSDQPPAEEVEYESYQIRAEDSKYKVKIINRGTKQSPIFYAVNKYHGPVEVFVEFTRSFNVSSSTPWPASYVVPPNSELHLTTLKIIDPYRASSFQYSMGSTLGDPNAVHNPNHAYYLPFVGNKHFYVSQAFGGKFTHTGDQSQYAIDIAMPEGSDILAARGGIVMDIAQDFYDGGVDASKLHRANIIRILHDDGSMAIYAHLLLESVIVGKGQRVKAQQKIAQSGNTGFSSGPHLHFAIQINDGYKLVSTPFLLKHKSGEIKTPKVGPI